MDCVINLDDFQFRRFTKKIGKIKKFYDDNAMINLLN